MTRWNAPEDRGRRHRWLIVADSLAMPRPGVGYDSTWPGMIARATGDIEWINRAVRGATTERLSSEGGGGEDCLEYFEPDGVVLQLGICDCAPRLLSRRGMTTRIIYRLPGDLGRRMTHWLEKRLPRRASNAWVPASEFERHVDQFLCRAGAAGVRVVALEILPVGQAVLHRNPKVLQQIALYNEIYRRLAKIHRHFSSLQVISNDENVESFLVDGYHLNAEGGHRVAAALMPAVACLAEPR